ncbi:hypothetical protein LOTGIDRAFT_164268 [Lottia gigantea]|uniref:EGF-like domain-containing protein n=1 Tax=Lottia gigantea TaxID=225164 RepID=V4A131_LOTGI|nr:hypothetical protein LOTGIDRAFT_164268 [Lottia gigantea]ESO90347.1 hypothetical protein LOTGIDRAFT_164268 [Lottia gigantea]
MWKWTLVTIFITAIQCARFGPDNSYTCHCLNDETCHKDSGFCGGGCATGWSDTSCQRRNPFKLALNFFFPFSQENVALGKPSDKVGTNRARIETSDRTANEPDKCSSSSNAITGKWWGIDLLEEYPIKHIIIQPNWDLASVNGILIHVIKEKGEPELCYKEGLSSTPPIVKNIECSHVIYGRYVNISNDRISHNGRYLTLCEVEIYVCSVGTFGSDCTNFCHCLNNERCSETGECPNGCSDGWTGTTCSQMCDNGTYGAGCLKLCSDRNCLVETSPCHHIYGSCQGGCTEGFYGEVCDMKCSDRKCKDSNLQCESKTGECIDGCQPGYQSIDCTRECYNGKYGQDCLLNCSSRFCKLETECNIIDGACNCSDGYQGIDCTVKQLLVFPGDANEGSEDQNSAIIAKIVVPIITLAFLFGVLVELFGTKLRSRCKTNQFRGNESNHTVAQKETNVKLVINQPSTNNQDNHSDQLLI